nr:hypothetical protein [Streptomyces sp. TRM72054]
MVHYPASGRAGGVAQRGAADHPPAQAPAPLVFADHVVSSARVGLVKPDPRIYRIAADLAGVALDRNEPFSPRMTFRL